MGSRNPSSAIGSSGEINDSELPGFRNLLLGGEAIDPHVLMVKAPSLKFRAPTFKGQIPRSTH